MSDQLTTEEQFFALKEFLVKTWKLIAIVIIIGLLAIWGWRYWQSSQAEKITAASDKYEQLVAALDLNEPTSIDELAAFAKETDTVYAVFANLQVAQFYVESLHDYAGAQTVLVETMKKTDSETVLSMINIRIARLQYQQGQYQESLQTLDKVTNENWFAVVNDIRGDVLVKMEQYTQACDAYQSALLSSPSPDLENNIKIKLNQAEYLQSKQAVDDAA